MPEPPLEELKESDVQNVYIFIADAVRYDALPDIVTDQGVSFKTVAHALTTPQCLPTIFSGWLPPKHDVTWFNQTVPDATRLLFDLDGYNTGYSELVWPGGALQNVLRNPEKANIESAAEPFVVVEHDNGGHAPYPHLDGEDPAEMLHDFTSYDEAQSEYRQTIEESANRFLERLDILEDRGVLEDTLVIYMADHGEIVGERGGFFGHQLPMVPEIAYVPMTFVHPSLPEGEMGDYLLQQVDLYPTLLHLLTGDIPDSDGETLLQTVPVDRPAYSRTVVHPPAKYRESRLDPAYLAEAVWTSDGGHVFVQNSRLTRGVMSIYEATRSGHTGAYNSHRSTPRMILRSVTHYLQNYHSYGSPSVGKAAAKAYIEQVDTGVEASESDGRELDEETKNHLESLGYR